MSIFIDTSAFLMMLDQSADEHPIGLKVWNDAVKQRATLITTNYVTVEAISLIQRRLGMLAVQVFCDRVTPVLQIEWIESDIHAEAISMMRTANLRDLSLVDCTSFTIMRRLGIADAFAFDRHFERQGFKCLR